MFFWRIKEKPEGEIYDWLQSNKEQVRVGTSSYMGTPVKDTTEFTQYVYVVSLPGITLIGTTPHFLPTSANGYLKLTRCKYGLISLLFGWWSLPWGPIFTLHALYVILSGGRRRTAESLLQLLESGWDGPRNLSVTAHRNDLLSVSDDALAEIQALMLKGNFPSEIGVRISPTQWADNEVEISFDYPVSDGRDWVGEARGLLLLVDKKDEDQLSGCQLNFRDNAFTARPV
jgi:Fe-S cluster assembly iron-binding protein IscA